MTIFADEIQNGVTMMNRQRLRTIAKGWQCSLLLAAMAPLTAGAADVVWYDGQQPVTYQVVGKPAPVVEQALRLFAADMELVTSRKAVAAQRAVIRIVQGTGSDDGFRLYVKNGQIVVEGHNPRGTAYGVLELSRLAGISPWVRKGHPGLWLG